MMLPAGVVQSIDANIVDLDNGWIFADQDIWSQDYSEVLLQPISIEAVDINDLRFKAAEVVVEIRATSDPTSLVLWSGWCGTVDDSGGGGIVALETRISCGVIDPVAPVFVNNGNGTATVFGFRCAIRPVPDYTKSPSDFEIAAQTLSFQDGVESYVCVKYIAGTPTMYVETNKYAINGSDVVGIYIVWRTGLDLRSISTDSRGIGLADKIAGMITRTKPYSLLYGQQLTLGVTTTPVVRTVTIAAAVMYAGVDAVPLAALDSSDPAQRLTLVAHTAGVYTFSNQTQIDNTNYDDGTNVVALGAHRYSVRWVYRTVGNDVQAFYVLGGDYTNISSAQAASIPSGLPIVVQNHAVLVGRIIIQAGVDTPVQIDQVASTAFQTSTANMHNNLDGLQGTGPDYYHMDVTRWTNTGNGPWLPLTAGIDNTVTGTLYGTGGADFGSGQMVIVHQGSGSTLAETYMYGGDLSLAGDGGRANLRVMGAISANTPGVGPNISFAGIRTGVGATGGGMMLQLTTNNGLDIYSWNNTAWIKKSQINSSGMIAVVGGTSAGFLKANGTIDTTGYLPADNPTFTGTLTGPKAILNGAQTQLVVGAVSNAGLIGWVRGSDGVGAAQIGYVASPTERDQFRYQTTGGSGYHSWWVNRNSTGAAEVARIVNDGSLQVYFGAGIDNGLTVRSGTLIAPSATINGWLGLPDVTFRPYTSSASYGSMYPSGVTPGATNYVMIWAKNGTYTQLNASTEVIVNIADVQKLKVTAGGINLINSSVLQINGTTAIDSNRNAAFAGLTTTGNTTFGSTTGSSSVQINSGAGTASSLNFLDNSVTRATLQLYTSNVFRLVARNTAGTEIDSPIYIDLTAGGKIVIGGTSRVTNFKNSLEMNGVVFVDASRNASFANLTTTGVTKISSTSGAYLYVDAGTGTASGVQMQYAGVTQAISRYIGPANTGAYQIVAYSGGSELDYPVNINMAAGGTISLNRNVSITGSLTASADITTSGDLTFANSGTSTRGVKGTMGDSDFWRIVGGATAANSGYLEIATADDGNEPIYVRQYTGTFSWLARQVTLLDAYGNSSFPGNVNCSSLVSSGDWIQAVGSTTKGRFKSQFAGNKASYIGNWPASNWWGIGPDGTTTGSKGVVRIGQCDTDGAWVDNGVHTAVLGDLQAVYTLYAANAIFGSDKTHDQTFQVRYGSPSGDPTAPGAVYITCSASKNPRIEMCDGTRNWTIDSWDSNLRFYVDGSIKAYVTRNSGFPMVGVTDGTAVVAGHIGQVIESRVTNVAGPSSTVIGTVTSITLTPGSWEVSGHVASSIADGVNLWTTVYSWCSTSTASMPNKGTTSVNTIYRPNSSVAAWATNTIEPVRIDVTSNTTCHLLVLFDGSATSITTNGAIRAVRIR